MAVRCSYEHSCLCSLVPAPLVGGLSLGKTKCAAKLVALMANDVKSPLFIFFFYRNGLVIL